VFGREWIWGGGVENAIPWHSRNVGNEKWKTETKYVRKKLEADRLIYPLPLAM
jgi:hypothetical protein